MAGPRRVGTRQRGSGPCEMNPTGKEEFNGLRTIGTMPEDLDLWQRDPET